MNINVFFSLLLFLAPGGCPIYSIDLSTLEVPNDFQNELTLQSMLSSELHEYRNKLNSNDVSAVKHFEQAHTPIEEDLFEKGELLRSIEDRIKATHYAAAAAAAPAAEAVVPVYDIESELEQQQTSKVQRSPICEMNFLGTNLFGMFPKKCFSTEDIALLSARQDFELLIPKSYPQTFLTDSIVYTLMKYFNSVNNILRQMCDDDTRRLMQRAFYDALGGYLRYYLMPVAQVSYYAGRLKLCTMERLMALYRQCRLVLNTNGNGWKMPVADVLSQLKNVHIQPIKLTEAACSEKDASSCALLDLNCMNNDVQNDQMLVPLPHLETEDINGFLTNIYLPFKHRRIYNLRTPEAAFIFVKFYKTLSSCYRFQGMCQKTYNQRLRLWIRENLQIHYRDEMFYPGLGGLLQVYEALTCVKLPEQSSSEKQGPVFSEVDSKDYHTTSDDTKKVAEEKKENMKQKTPKPKTNEKKIGKKNKKKNKEEDSVKQSRSLQQNQTEGDTEDDEKPSETHDADGIQMNKNPKGEDCVECDDENYVVYIAAFLGLLLLLLLLLICFCLRRHKHRQHSTKLVKEEKIETVKKIVVDKTENTDKPEKEANKMEKGKAEKGKAAKGKPKKGKAEKVDAEQPNEGEPEYKPVKAKRGCWSTLFGSRKERASYVIKDKVLGDPGLTLLGSSRRDRAAALNNVEKLIHRKKDAYSAVNHYDEDSLTSTSSLGYQFRRKCIPPKKLRERKDEYYLRSEKKRFTSSSKHKERERDQEALLREQIPNEHEEISSEELEVDANLRRKAKQIREIRTQSKFSRQKGGLANNKDSESFDSESNVRSDSYRSKESESGKQTSSTIPKDKETSKISPVPSTRGTQSPVPDSKSELPPEDPETMPTRAHSRTSTNNSKHTESWETTFDD